MLGELSQKEAFYGGTGVLRRIRDFNLENFLPILSHKDTAIKQFPFMSQDVGLHQKTNLLML